MQLENKIRFDRPMRPDLASLIAAPMLSERTIAVAGHPTRIILETMVWDGLDEVAQAAAASLRPGRGGKVLLRG